MTSRWPGDREVDDWFDEPGKPDPWSARVDRLTRERQAREGRRPETGGGPAPTRPGRAVLFGAALLVLLLLVGLAAAGVFSGGSRKAVTTTVTRAARPATVTVTVTKPQAASTTPSTPLKPGDQGTAVSRLQRALERAGYLTGAVDGVYGPATTQAVTRFQQAHGLTADGIAGPQTLAALQPTG